MAREQVVWFSHDFIPNPWACMKLSSKSLYAVRALFDMAYHGIGEPSKIDEIAGREHVPPRFLEQIFQDLKRAEIVASKRGPKGGYYLVAAPGDITLGQVIRSVEGQTHTSFCRETRSHDEPPTPSMRVTGEVWHKLAEGVDAVLDGVTIEDLVRRGEKLGLRRESYNEFVYVI
jgi:Rrf2 family iron-sulfur cluster assembly transcriptional regulator